MLVFSFHEFQQVLCSRGLFCQNIRGQSLWSGRLRPVYGQRPCLGWVREGSPPSRERVQGVTTDKNLYADLYISEHFDCIGYVD